MVNDSPIFEFRGPWGVPIQIGQSIIFLGFLIIGLNSSPTEFIYGVAFLAVLVGSIYLHELGHAWGCLIQGVPVRRIMLHGSGGFCERSRSTTPKQDELIIAMGPIVNLTIWALASLLLPYISADNLYWLVSIIAELNLWLAIFNLLPISPLDGGRLLHCVLYRFLPSKVVTRICGAIGLAGVVLWIPLMIFCFWAFGFVMLFFPPVRLHWHMLRHASV